MPERGTRVQVTVRRGYLALNKKELRATFRQAGNEIARDTRAMLRGAGGGVVYRGPGGSAQFRGGYKKGRFQASTPGAPPAHELGALAKSIRTKVFRNSDGVAIRATAFYALMLESGAQGGGGRKGARNNYAKRGGKRFRVKINGQRVLAPRPFLTVALERRGPELARRLQNAIENGIEFKRTR
jgi:hypothetical protein